MLKFIFKIEKILIINYRLRERLSKYFIFHKKSHLEEQFDWLILFTNITLYLLILYLLVYRYLNANRNWNQEIDF